MKLHPTQIVGLVAVVAFGGILVWTLLKPKPDPFHLPGAIPMADVPQPSIPVPAIPSPAVSTPSDPLAVGSEDAKDDLYCSGLIFAAHRASNDVMSADATTRRNQVIALAEAGVKKLIDAGVATSATTAPIADAHTDKAAADFAAGSPRISLQDCQARAAALPTSSPN